MINRIIGPSLTIDPAMDYGRVLYGSDDRAIPMLAERITKVLSEMEEGSVLRIDLTNTDIIDLGFLLGLYKTLGKTPPGKAIIYENSRKHASIGSLPYRLETRKPAIILALNEGVLSIHGRSFIVSSCSTLTEAYLRVSDSSDGVTSKSLVSALVEKSMSQSNASNQLNRLWRAGLLKRVRERLGENHGPAYRYWPILKGVPFTVDQERLG